MKKTYKMKITPACFNDLDNIFRYISETVKEPISANRLMDEIEKAFRNTLDFPLIHPLAGDSVLSEKGYRKLVVKNYIVLYLIDDENCSVIFARVFYGKQDYAKLL